MGSSVGQDTAQAGSAADHGSWASVDDDVRSFPAQIGYLRILDVAALSVLAVVAVVLRFWTRSPMWLDEALTVHIAQQPIGQIPAALHHDGHPPLYYVLLHGWMTLFGTSNVAIRALPGIFGVLVLPATFLVGRRAGGRTVAWCAVVLVAVLPYAIRYSTENRMYSLLMLLALVAWLCADSILRRPRPVPIIGLFGCTSALLWSQYWALWLGAAAGIMVIAMLIRDWRGRRRERLRSEVWILGALVAGGLTFIPWLPTMLYQQAHTGTPWAARSMPPTVLVTTVEALGGASNATNEVGGWIFTIFIFLGAFGAGVASGRFMLDLRTQIRPRRFVWIAGLTFAIGVAVMLVTNTAFQPRYNAVWLPFALVLGGFGLAAIRGPLLQRGALVLVLVAAASGCYQNITLPRTQAGQTASSIEMNGKSGDVVGVCPDQLGPSLTRELSPGFDVGSYPTFSDPHTVDWADYVKRTHAATPKQFAAQLLQRAGDNHRVFLVWSDSYTTHKKLCNDVVRILAENRPKNQQLVTAKYRYYESANLTMFEPLTP